MARSTPPLLSTSSGGGDKKVYVDVLDFTFFQIRDYAEIEGAELGREVVRREFVSLKESTSRRSIWRRWESHTPDAVREEKNYR
jgi:hypothetical protein